MAITLLFILTIKYVKIMKTPILLFLSMVFFSGCIKPVPVCTSPPPAFDLRIVDGANNDLLSPQYLGNFKDSIQLYYYDKAGSKQDVTFTDSLMKGVGNNKEYQIFSGSLPWASLSGNKTFYLKRSRKITDTLFIDVVNKIDQHCNYSAYDMVKLNGVPLAFVSDSSYTYYLAIDKN
jgi:hypothetical protein